MGGYSRGTIEGGRPPTPLLSFSYIYLEGRVGIGIDI